MTTGGLGDRRGLRIDFSTSRIECLSTQRTNNSSTKTDQPGWVVVDFRFGKNPPLVRYGSKLSILSVDDGPLNGANPVFERK